MTHTDDGQTLFPTTGQTGDYVIRRRAKVERFRLENTDDAERAINEWLAEFTDPGWQFIWNWYPGVTAPTLCVLAVHDDLENINAEK